MPVDKDCLGLGTKNTRHYFLFSVFETSVMHTVVNDWVTCCACISWLVLVRDSGSY
uniref:Uncharacterized protein n=1 Tax=Anguilla anguilla TaxID=7936 RepID=A0A0E9WPM1_ANGAN